MNFSGRKDNVFKEKLPEGFAQADQNSRRRTRGIWRPRQGLSRPAGIGKSAERIDSIGYGEVGIKTGLMIEHGGSIDGYAIGVNDVSPVWTPPPPRDWFYEAPTLTVLQTGAGEVTLTPASTNSYVITFNFYRDGVFIGTGDTLVDTEAVDGADYTTEAVTDAGVTSIPSAPVTATVWGTFFSDDFNRADGALGANWGSGFGTIAIVSMEAVGQDSANLAGVPALDLQAATTFLISADLDFVSVGTSWTLGVEIGPLAITQRKLAVVVFKLLSDSNWKLGLYANGSFLATATGGVGTPPDGTVEFRYDGSQYIGSFAGYEVSSAPPAALPGTWVPGLWIAPSSGSMSADDFICGYTE